MYCATTPGGNLWAPSSWSRIQHPRLQIGNVVVAPAAQGFGYGRVLLEFAERFGRNGGFVALTLFTNVKMHENFGLYAKMGYSEVGRRTESGYERVFFLKKL